MTTPLSVCLLELSCARLGYSAHNNKCVGCDAWMNTEYITEGKFWKKYCSKLCHDFLIAYFDVRTD